MDAKTEHSLLLEELKVIEFQIVVENLDIQGSKRHIEVIEHLEEIGSDSAERRATALLENLGFTSELRGRPLSQLSGGWHI